MCLNLFCGPVRWNCSVLTVTTMWRWSHGSMRWIHLQKTDSMHTHTHECMENLWHLSKVNGLCQWQYPGCDIVLKLGKMSHLGGNGWRLYGTSRQVFPTIACESTIISESKKNSSPFKRLEVKITIGKDAEQSKPFCPVDGDVKWWKCCSKQ